MKASYFNQDKADDDDIMLEMVKEQGYVPETCLLGGELVFILMQTGEDPCKDCNCDRAKCHGRYN